MSFNDLIVESGEDYSARVSIVINRQLFGPGSKIPKRTRVNGKSLRDLAGQMLDVDLIGGVYLINILSDQIKFKFI